MSQAQHPPQGKLDATFDIDIHYYDISGIALRLIHIAVHIAECNIRWKKYDTFNTRYISY